MREILSEREQCERERGFGAEMGGGRRWMETNTKSVIDWSEGERGRQRWGEKETEGDKPSP